MADELTAWIRSHHLEGKIIAVGHSLGAVVSMIAEINSPGLFRGLWCFEPVLFTEKALGQYYSDVSSISWRVACCDLHFLHSY